MSTRLFCIICLVSMALVGNVQAVDTTWTDATGDHLWSTPGNWDTGNVPTSADWAKVRNGLPGPKITSESALANRVHIGYLEGGALTVDSGTLVISGDDLMIGKQGGPGILNMNGGTITIARDLEVSGDTIPGPGFIYMTGGTIIVGDDFELPETETHVAAIAEVYLDGGTIILNDSFEGDSQFRMYERGLLDVGIGTLIVPGDDTSDIQGFIDNGWIIAYGGNGTAYVVYDAISDKTTVYAIHSLNPQPANGASVSVTTSSLGWTLPDPNSTGGTVTCDVVFGTDPNMANLAVNTLLVDGETVETVALPDPLEKNKDYYWQITVYDTDFVEPALVSPVFTFNTYNVAPIAVAGDDIETWLVGGTRDITLAGTYIDDDGPGPYSYLWEITSNANDLNPATLDDPTLPNATVTLPEIGAYTLSLTVNDGADPSEEDSLQITVYADACEHAQNQAGFEALVGDTDDDCDVDMEDLANLSANWLEENYSIE